MEEAIFFDRYLFYPTFTHRKQKQLSIMKKIATLVLLFAALTTKAQMTVDTTQTPNDLIQNHLLGAGVYVDSITYAGSLNQMASFINGGAGISNGIIMTNGKNTGPWAPASLWRSTAMNNNSDPDLAAIVAPQTIHDASVLEFDFKVGSDSVKFNFVFSSEEYNDYVNTSFNDVFGFFISGPGIIGNQNIALIPGTNTPVSINNVNNGGPYSGVSSGPCTNCNYYIDNVLGSTFAGDGYTTVLTAQVAVQPCTVYHIKLAIADVADQAFDSFVMLEDNSFQACSTPRIMANNVPATNDTLFILQGDSVQLSAIQGPNYMWSNGATTQSIYASQSGNYTVAVTNGNCFALFNALQVEAVVMPTPVITYATAVINSTVTDLAYSYTWYLDGTLITGANSSTLNVTAPGCYLLVITDVHGLKVSSNLLCLTAAGINYVATEKAAMLIPNPVTQNAKLLFNNKGKEQMTLKIYSVDGSVVKQDITNEEQFNIVKGNMNAGVYFYEITNTKAAIIYKGKMIIQ